MSYSHCVAVFLLLALLLLATGANAGSAQPVKFASAKPLFAKLAMGGEGAPVVALAFDESHGTGKGHDVLYADTNGNSVFESSEKHTTEKGSGPATFLVTLPATLFPAAIADETIAKMAALRVTLYSLGNLNPSTMMAVNLHLTRGEETWDYSLISSGGTPSGDLKAATVLHAGPLEIVPTIRPGVATGIAARLQAGDFSLSCAGPNGASTDVTILVKNQAGQTVHQESVPLGRLGFG
jgi:hypothetical protein